MPELDTLIDVNGFVIHKTATGFIVTFVLVIT